MRGPVFALGIPRFRSALAPAPIASSPPAGTTIVAARAARPALQVVRRGSHSPKTSSKTTTKPIADITSNPAATISHAGRPFETRPAIVAAFEMLANTAPATSATITSNSAPRHARRAGLDVRRRARGRPGRRRTARRIRRLLESGGRSREPRGGAGRRATGELCREVIAGKLSAAQAEPPPGALVRRLTPTPSSASSHPSKSSVPDRAPPSSRARSSRRPLRCLGTQPSGGARAALKSREIDSPGTVILQSRCIPATSDRGWFCDSMPTVGRPARRSPICLVVDRRLRPQNLPGRSSVDSDRSAA